jgi:molybdate transport system substrate-binding protein
LIRTILLAFQAFAAGEGSKESPRTTLTVAAAADLTFALHNLVADFQVKNPTIKVNVTYGSSGNFFAQLQNGHHSICSFLPTSGIRRSLPKPVWAPKKFFFMRPGRIVVWVPKDSPLDVDELGIKALLDPSIRRVAVADSKQAPYGRAAVRATKTKPLLTVRNCNSGIGTVGQTSNGLLNRCPELCLATRLHSTAFPNPSP